MPIIGFTDTIQPRFPRLGKLRKGGEKTNGQFGPDLDHFRFVSADADIVQAFTDAYGTAPRLINVYIPHEKPADAFPTWAEIWGASGLVHRCDGQTMSIWLEGDKYVRGEKPCSGGHKDGDYLKDAVGRLDVIIPELVMAGHVGYVTLETHGKHDMIAILSVLQQVSEEGRRDLRGVPFVLRRVQESVSTPGFGKNAGKRSRVDKWLVKLEPSADWVKLQLDMARSTQMLEAGDTHALPGSVDNVDAETGEIYEAKQPADEITPLGEALYPGGVWAQKKAAIVKHYKTDAAVLEFLKKRKDSLSNGELIQHVGTNWPGYEALIEPVKAQAGAAFDPLQFLQGVAALAETQRTKPEQFATMTTEQQTAVVLSKITDAAIPEEFR